jgi:two-component system NtrC family sensor kinase
MTEMLGAGRQDDAIAGRPGQPFYMARPSGAAAQSGPAAVCPQRALHHEMWMRDAAGQAALDADQRLPGGIQRRPTGIWWMLQDRTEVRAAQEELRQRFAELQQTNQKLEQAQNQLLQSDKMASIGQLAAGVAHEINNPVGFVSSNLNTLRQYVTSLLTLADAYGRHSQPPPRGGPGAGAGASRRRNWTT